MVNKNLELTFFKTTFLHIFNAWACEKRLTSKLAWVKNETHFFKMIGLSHSIKNSWNQKRFFVKWSLASHFAWNKNANQFQQTFVCILTRYQNLKQSKIACFWKHDIQSFIFTWHFQILLSYWLRFKQLCIITLVAFIVKLS